MANEKRDRNLENQTTNRNPQNQKNRNPENQRNRDLENEKNRDLMRNEGEGSKSSARDYNNKAERFARSGQVEENAREAMSAIDGEEGEELREAERAGKRRIAEDDPDVQP